MSLRAAIAHLLLPRYAAGDLPPWLSRVVRDGLDESPDLAEAYTALRRAERAAPAATARRPTSAAQRELLEASLFAALPLPGAQTPARVTRRFAGALPVLAACASVGLFLVVANDRGEDDTFSAQDLSARGTELASHPLGVRVSCVADDRVFDDATAGARRPSDRLECPQDGLLGFAMTNLSERARWVFVVGVAPGGETRWYAPFERGGAAFEASAGADNQVLPALGALGSMPKDDHVTLYVLLSDRPFSGADVERQLEAARARGTPLGALDRLPLADIPLQARIELLGPAR